MASTRPAGWISSNFPGYRLEKQVVIRFLEDKFGNWEDGSYSEQDFDVKVRRTIQTDFAKYSHTGMYSSNKTNTFSTSLGA